MRHFGLGISSFEVEFWVVFTRNSGLAVSDQPTRKTQHNGMYDPFRDVS